MATTLIQVNADDKEKVLALDKFKYEMAIAEESIREGGTISSDDIEVNIEM